MVSARPTVRLRRWIAAICLCLIVLLGSAVAVVRVQFEGPDLAENICEMMNARMRGRIRIASIEWPLSALPKVATGGWLPVTLRRVQIWDAEGETVLKTERVTGELDLHSLIFGRHDFVLRKITVHGGETLLREVREPYPLHDYDTTAFSIIAAFYGRRTAGFRAGIFASPSPLWDLRDFEVRDVDVEIRTKPLDDPGNSYLFRARVNDVSAKGFLFMDPSDPLVPKFYVSMTMTGGEGQVDLWYARGKDGAWKPNGEYSFPVQALEVRRLAQLPSRWPADPVANTLRFDIVVQTKNGARATVDGSMIDYWDTPYGGIWDVTARVENAGLLLHQSIDPDAGGDAVTLEAVVTGPIVFYPSVAIKATGLTYKLSVLEPPLLLTLDALDGVYDLAVDEGSVDEFIARGADGEVRLSAKWGGDGSDRSPLWVDSDIDIRKAIEMKPWLPDTLSGAVGSRLDGHFHALRRKGETKYGITVDKLDLRLGRLAIDRGQIYLDKSLDKVLLDGVRFGMPGFQGTLRCSIFTGYDTLRFDDQDCEAEIESGDIQALIRLFQGAGRKQRGPAKAAAPAKRAALQPRHARRPLRRPHAQAQASPAPTRATGTATTRGATQGKGTVKIGGSLDDLKLQTDVALSGVPCIGAVRGSVRYEGDTVIIDDARSTSLGGRLRVSGRVKLEPSPWFEPLRVVATGVDLSKTCAIKEALSGKVSADITLRGPPDPTRLTFTGHACSDRVVALGETLGDVALWLNRAPGKLTCASAAPVPIGAAAIDACLRTGAASGGRCAILRARREAGGELAAAIHADKGQRLGGELMLSRLPLAALTRLAGAALPADAVIETSGLRLGGTLDAPTLDGVIRLSRTWAGTGYLGDGDLAVRPDGAGRVRFAATFLDGRVAISGTLGTRAPYPLELTADVQQLELDTFVDLATVGAPAGTRVWGSGRIQVKTALAGAAAPLAIQLDLADLAIVAAAPGPDGQPTPLAVRAAAPLQLTWDGATARLVQPARLTTPLGELTVAGEASVRKLDLVATGKLDLIRAQPLLGAYFDRTTGTAELQARITGPSLVPSVQVILDLDDVALRLTGQDAMLRVPGGRIAFTDGDLSFTGVSVEVDDGYTQRRPPVEPDPDDPSAPRPLRVKGGVSFDGFTPRTWALLIEGDLAGEMLMAFAPEVFAQASGRASLSMWLKGDGATPPVEGALTFGEGRQLRLLPRALRRELALDAGSVSFKGPRAADLAITIDGVGGKIDDEGTLRDVRGSIALRDYAVAVALVEASADGLTFRLQRTLDLVLSLDAMEVRYDGSRLAIEGGVELTSGRYTRNFDLGEALTPSTPTGPSAPPLWETTPLLGDAALKLQVDVRKFSVINNLANIDLYGRVAITGTPRDPRFDDTIHVERGTFRIPGVRPRFSRTSGRVEFSPLGRVPAQTPTLDITSEADYRDPSGQDHLITLSIAGNLSQLTWDLTTSSGLDKGQTLTLILSGRTPEELRRNLGDQSVAIDPTRIDPSTDSSQGVTDELVRQVAGDLLENRVADPLRELSNLDVARIELNLSSFGFHAEKRLFETLKWLGDFERTTRGSSINVRLEQRLPHHAISRLLRPFFLSSIAGEANLLVKSFDDAAEQDVTDLELKFVFRLLYGK